MLEAKMMLRFIWDVLWLRGCGSLVVVGLVVVTLIVVLGLLFVRL